MSEWEGVDLSVLMDTADADKNIALKGCSSSSAYRALPKDHKGAEKTLYDL